MSVTLLVLAASTAARTRDEFINPSQTRLPAPSSHNRTPACPTNVADDFQCTVPRQAWPPRDRGNPELYLNSAYWPAEERPDIEEYAIQRHGYRYRNCEKNSVHYCFLVDARAAGYPVSHKPKVGDLWLASCDALTLANGLSGFECPAHDWLLGYVFRVLRRGAFLQSWGGSDTPADSGLQVTEFAGSMDPHTDFVGLLPRGTHRPK